MSTRFTWGWEKAQVSRLVGIWGSVGLCFRAGERRQPLCLHGGVTTSDQSKQNRTSTSNTSQVVSDMKEMLERYGATFVGRVGPRHPPVEGEASEWYNCG